MLLPKTPPPTTTLEFGIVVVVVVDINDGLLGVVGCIDRFCDVVVPPPTPPPVKENIEDIKLSLFRNLLSHN